MDSLATSFGGTSLGGAVSVLQGTQHVYISEVSSPTRFWIQTDEAALQNLHTAMGLFYGKIESQSVDLSSPFIAVKGQRVAAYAFGQWHRAEVISDSEFNQRRGRAKLFFMDYGTTGFVDLRKCNILIEEFSQQPKIALRASLAKIKPKGGARLWDLNVTDHFLELIREKKLRVKIVRHHDLEDYYEVMLYTWLYDWPHHPDTEKSINRLLVESGFADKIEPNETPNLASPSFQMLETLTVYPTYGERCHMQSHYNIDFNNFEQKYIAPVTNTFGFESELTKALSDVNFGNIKKAFVEVFGLSEQIFSNG